MLRGEKNQSVHGTKGERRKENNNTWVRICLCGCVFFSAVPSFRSSLALGGLDGCGPTASNRPIVFPFSLSNPDPPVPKFWLPIKKKTQKTQGFIPCVRAYKRSSIMGKPRRPSHSNPPPPFPTSLSVLSMVSFFCRLRALSPRIRAAAAGEFFVLHMDSSTTDPTH